MANKLLKADPVYSNWLGEIKQRYAQSQLKAALQVNQELLQFYWRLGRDIILLEAEKRWGTAFYTTLSNDLMNLLPGVKGLSVKNLYYMKRFFLLTRENENFPQAVGNLDSPYFSIPWGHVRTIIDKFGTEPEKARFYAEKTLENNWSRNVLLNFLDTRLYERQGKGITNFQLALPSPQSDLAQEVTRDPYVFDFLAIREKYDEKELKDALMSNIQRFFMELGTGFALIGREFRLQIGKTEQFLDFLFYHARLHCYVVIEVKTRQLEPGDMGQLGTYVAAVNEVLKQENDMPTIGLLICKTKDNIMAKYASSAMNIPIGVSEYELSNLFPDNYKGSLPSIEEIEAELATGGGSKTPLPAK